jgi:hypothetical protein
MQWFRSHLTFANVISMCALFVALGGVSYAALKLPRNSVGSKQIKSNAVKSSKVKPASLRASDFRAGDLPEGERGPAGPQGAPGSAGAAGPAGANGTADAFARVGSDAARTLQPNVAGFPPQNKDIEQVDVAAGEAGAATGTTCFDTPQRPASAMAVVDNADAGANVDLIATVAIDRGEDLGDCPGTHNDARVRIIDTDLTAGGADQDPGPANARFFVWFEY